MKLKEYVSLHGLADTAKLFGVSVPAIKHWIYGVRSLPPERVIPFATATEWKVTPHELRPDIYPNPTDGMPTDQSPIPMVSDHAPA